ncbi:hypothetical protein Y032_0006g3144 [Ancylostoma ceylanicum]|uniref:Uncharacterized protein n=1 Tax=Ancylostoma ceylanicum TaxID=53326 RepID=A0A016VSI2_9BILA|nr:hypothetical protein Y032_0006g3144 [Ancylostoma ceylanicum]
MLSTTSSSQKPASVVKRSQLMVGLGLLFLYTVMKLTTSSSTKELRYNTDVGQAIPLVDDDVVNFITVYKKRSPKPTINCDLFTTLAGFWEDDVVDNIDEEYERLIQHLCDSAKKAEGSRTTKRRLSHETLELVRQRGAARAADNYQLTPELTKQCREAIRKISKRDEQQCWPKPQRQVEASTTPAKTLPSVRLR